MSHAPYSECYTVLRDEDAVGRVDIHFADGMVHSTLNASDTLSSDDIQDLIDTVDADLIGAGRQQQAGCHRPRSPGT